MSLRVRVLLPKSLLLLALSVAQFACQSPMNNVSAMSAAPETQTPLTLAESDRNVANVYRMPAGDNDVVGDNYHVALKAGDSLKKIANRYDVSQRDLVYANPQVNFKHIKQGQALVIPKQYVLPPEQYRNGIVVNIPEARIYYFTPDHRFVKIFPVALGRAGWRTPVGKTWVIKKVEKPVWTVPDSIREHAAKSGRELPKVVQPGPQNPLGPFALYLGLKGYLIHGTNDPSSIGKLVSSGCIRMYNHDIEELFNDVNVGTPVHLIHYPNKLGWLNNKLYLEAYHPVMDEQGNYDKDAVSVEQLLAAEKQKRSITIDEDSIAKTLKTRQGVPMAINQLG